MKILIAFAIVAAIAMAHPTHYKVDRNETCYNPEPAKVYSWHIHLLFWQKNEESVKNAVALR